MTEFEKPLYTHDCEHCVFLGTWVREVEGLLNQTFDLYVCPRGTLGTNCIARWGNDGPEYSSMTMENPLWRSSLAHINGPRRSMYECYIPELCEAWRRWAERERREHLVKLIKAGVIKLGDAKELGDAERMIILPPAPMSTQKDVDASIDEVVQRAKELGFLLQFRTRLQWTANNRYELFRPCAGDLPPQIQAARDILDDAIAVWFQQTVLMDVSDG